MPIFKKAPTTSTSSHLDSTALGLPFSTAAAAAAFFVWMYRSVFRKWRVIISGVCTPSSSPGGARCDGCTSGEAMLSIDEVMSSTRLLTNFGVTCPYVAYQSSGQKGTVRAESSTHVWDAPVEVVQILVEGVTVQLDSDDLLGG